MSERDFQLGKKQKEIEHFAHLCMILASHRPAIIRRDKIIDVRRTRLYANVSNEKIRSDLLFFSPPFASFSPDILIVALDTK